MPGVSRSGLALLPFRSRPIADETVAQTSSRVCMRFLVVAAMAGAWGWARRWCMSVGAERSAARAEGGAESLLAVSPQDAAGWRVQRASSRGRFWSWVPGTAAQRRSRSTRSRPAPARAQMLCEHNNSLRPRASPADRELCGRRLVAAFAGFAARTNQHALKKQS